MPDPSRRPVRLVTLLVLSATLAVAGFQLRPSSASATTFSGPITISRGGTYTGSWESTDANLAAVTITTSEPVTIESSTIKGRGHLILGRANLNLTVRNTAGYGTNSMVKGKPTGRFLTTDYGFTNVNLEHNYLEQTGGIWLYDYKGNSTPANTVRVVDNKARNIDGRHSDGKGGYLNGPGDASFVQFVQFDRVRNVPGVEIGWNEVINNPFQSRVEDNINLYKSGGTASSPMRIHDNLIWGAYPNDPAGHGFSGGGIIMGDEASGANKAGHVDVFNNQIIGTTNYGLSIVCGNDQKIHDNRIVAANVLPDGRPVHAQNVGLSMGSAALWGANCDNYVNNQAYNNHIGWARANGGRNDWWVPSCNSCSNNTSMPGPITLTTEQAEYGLWLTKLAAANRTVGLRTSGASSLPSAPPPTTTKPAPPTTKAPAPTTTKPAPPTTKAPAPTTTVLRPPPTTVPRPSTTRPPRTTVPPTPKRGDKRPVGTARAATYTRALTTLAPTSATNGWGPYERNSSNGGKGVSDGSTITLNGTTYRRGLGVHAGSTLTYDVGGRYRQFRAAIGIDDEEATEGTVTFEVWVDGKRVYNSPTMRPSSPTANVTVDLTGARELKLVVTDAGDGHHHDHADWADARLVR